jgi:hypothetical protein
MFHVMGSFLVRSDLAPRDFSFSFQSVSFSPRNFWVVNSLLEWAYVAVAIVLLVVVNPGISTV